MRALHLELGRLDTVEHVAALPRHPRVVVTSHRELPRVDVAAAVSGAGYDVVHFGA